MVERRTLPGESNDAVLAELRGRGLRVLPSAANFLLFGPAEYFSLMTLGLTDVNLTIGDATGVHFAISGGSLALATLKPTSTTDHRSCARRSDRS